jgi:hypothetical protein
VIELLHATRTETWGSGKKMPMYAAKTVTVSSIEYATLDFYQMVDPGTNQELNGSTSCHLG